MRFTTLADPPSSHTSSTNAAPPLVGSHHSLSFFALFTSPQKNYLIILHSSNIKNENENKDKNEQIK